jgi:hypothetical protein
MKFSLDTVTGTLYHMYVNLPGTLSWWKRVGIRQFTHIIFEFFFASKEIFHVKHIPVLGLPVQ